MKRLNDCWNRIGVQGDHRCERLPEVIHCRNCDVYAAAARTVLDSLPPQESAPAPLRAASRASLALLVFRVGPEWLALPSRSLEEVAAMRPIQRLPHQRDPAVLGLTNIRGTLTPCLSLAQVLGLTVPARACVPRMLIFGKGARRVVLPVDEVGGIHGVDGAALEPIPLTVQYAPARFSRGMAYCASRLVGVLDEDILMNALEQSLA
ncbi:chemotaxis protein [Bordetella avium 197N]|uniref:Chemotaxis protein CheW n=2 Tax=Bordetella avium TaxID=521 RepID=Q2KV70_BORA1|nr:chemotaxis protein [Bordetella avium 197N]